MLQPLLIHCKQDPESDLSLLGRSWVAFKVCPEPQHGEKDGTITQIAKCSAAVAHFVVAFLVIPPYFQALRVSNCLICNSPRCR